MGNSQAFRSHRCNRAAGPTRLNTAGGVAQVDRTQGVVPLNRKMRGETDTVKVPVENLGPKSKIPRPVRARDLSNRIG